MPNLVTVKGEVRSHDEEKLKKLRIILYHPLKMLLKIIIRLILMTNFPVWKFILKKIFPVRIFLRIIRLSHWPCRR